MNEVQQIFNSPTNSILLLIAVLVGFRYLYDLYKWYKDRFKEKHEDINHNEEFHQEVSNIACVSREHTETLKKINQTLDCIMQRITELEHHHDDDMNKEINTRHQEMKDAERERKLDIVASAKVWLFRLYEELKDKPTLTMVEYETFDGLAQRYLAAGGNSIFQNKIIPEIRQKPIDEDIKI